MPKGYQGANSHRDNNIARLVTSLIYKSIANIKVYA